jgi:hypothetical protein
MPVSKVTSPHNRNHRNRAVESLCAMALELHRAQSVSAGRSEEER